MLVPNGIIPRNVNLISIGRIEGNSGSGSPLYSKQGLMVNTHFQVFNDVIPKKEPAPPEEPLTYAQIQEEFEEFKHKKKFETALQKHEKKEKRIT